jgi:hypothetical protein
VQVVSNPPRPRRFDEEVNRIIWVSVDCIVDLVGVAQVCYCEGTVILKSLFLVDKYGYSEA